jgi:hypothetical protein
MWLRKLCPALLFLGSLNLFLFTLAPTVTFVDSGELIVTAKNLGVAHPPGFPLYLLIAHLATLLPIGNVAQRVHFVSALSAAIAVVLIYLVTSEAILYRFKLSAKQHSGKLRPREKQNYLPEKFLFVPGLVAGSLAAFSRTLWAYATVAEVYTLNAVLILVVLLLVLRWRSRFLDWNLSANPNAQQLKSTSADRSGNQPSGIPSEPTKGAGNGRLYLAAFVFGLALGVHHITVALTLPAIAWLVYKTRGAKFFRSRHLPVTALACLLGCAVYVYLPISASRAPVLNWGNPDTPARFWTHITGRQYQSNLSLSPDQIRRQAALYAKLVFREFAWPWFPAALVLAGIGFYSLYRRDRTLLIFLALVMGFNFLFAMSYEIAEDKDAYSLPVFLVIAIAAGIGAHAVLAGTTKRRGFVAAIIILIGPVLAFAANVRINNRRDFHIAEDYVGNIFSSISPNGLLLTSDWQVASPTLYFQEISGQRPDLICIDVLLLKRSWYYAYLETKYPVLMQQARNIVRLFMEDLLQWEKDPDAYQVDPQLNQRIDARFNSMIATLVGKHLSTGPVYATTDVVISSGGENHTLAKSLLESYQIVPQGLVFQLFADRGFHKAELPQLNMRGLIDRSPAINEDQVVRQKVVPVYAIMLVNCGRAFASQGDTGRAMEAFRQAWEIDSSLIVERNLLPPGVSF